MVFSHVCYILVLSMKVQRTEHFLFHKSGLGCIGVFIKESTAVSVGLKGLLLGQKQIRTITSEPGAWALVPAAAVDEQEPVTSWQD